MLPDKLPDLHQPLVDLIRKIAPRVTVGLVTDTTGALAIMCESPSRCMVLHLEREGWSGRGCELTVELDLVEALCWLVEAPRLAGPADVAELLAAEQAKHRGIEDMFVLERQCAAALESMDSAAVLACSRALPNNDWRKHAV